MTPTRTEFLHISSPEKVLFYVLAFVSVLILALQVWQRARLWRSGQPITWKPLGWRGVWSYVLLQRKVRKSRRSSGAPMHLLIFYGFAALFLATTLLAVNTYSPVKFHLGTYYLIYELVFDALGLLFVIGVGWAVLRRAFFPPRSMRSDWSDWLALILLLLLGVTGYLLEAARLANKVFEQSLMDPGDEYSFVGYAIAQAIGPVSGGLYKGLWWFHAAQALTFIALVPQFRIRHILFAIFTAWGGETQPMGELKPISLEEVEKTGEIGVAHSADYSRWHLMSLDACMECGRCTDVCPANGVGKVLNPQKVVQDIRGAMRSGVSVAEAVSEEALWACTTCNACVEACPVLIRHVDLIVDARRNLVAEGKLSGSGALVLRQIASTGNAWGASADAREDWMQGLDIPLCRDGADFEYLFWVGCAGATDPGAIKTTRAVAQLLKRAGIKFACLGREEACTGDPARRIGEEFLFQEKAQANVETFKRYGVKKVVTPCPHCFNTLKNEYRQFGAELEAVHHSQLLGDLVRQGRLKAAAPVKGKLAFHDPCYLARVNGVVDSPREVLGGGSRLAKPMNRGEKTLCCGAGGGRMWMEEPAHQRPGDRRAKELLATGAESVAVACPFCRIMLDASLKQVSEREVRLLDLAEALQEANA